MCKVIHSSNLTGSLQSGPLGQREGALGVALRSGPVYCQIRFHRPEPARLHALEPQQSVHADHWPALLSDSLHHAVSDV